MKNWNRTEPLAFRIERGARFPLAIEAAVSNIGLKFCEITGFGSLDSVELAGSSDGELIRFEGHFDLLSLNGRLRQAGEIAISEYVCTLARHTDNGIQMLGGRLRGADIAFLEIAVSPLQHLEISGETAILQEPTENPVAPTITQEPQKAPSKPKLFNDTKWEEVISESTRLEREGRSISWIDSPEVIPSRGDLVNHRQFGRCDVVKIDDDHISLRKPDGRTVQLGLAILEFKVIGKSGSKTEYDVAIKKT